MTFNIEVPSTRQFFALFDQESLAKLQEHFYSIGLANAAIVTSRDGKKFGASAKSSSIPMGISVVQLLALCLTRLGLNSPVRRLEAGPSLASLLEMIISFFRLCDRTESGLVRWTDCVARYNASDGEQQNDQVHVRRKRLFKARATNAIVDSFNHGPKGITDASLAKIGRSNFVLVADSGSSPPAMKLLKLNEYSIEVWKSLPFKHEEIDFTDSTIMCCGYCSGDYTAGALLSSQRLCFWDTRGTVNECRMKSVMNTGNLATLGLWPSVQLGNRWVTCARVRGKAEGLITGQAIYSLTLWDHFERRSIGTMTVVNSYKEGRESPTTAVIDAGHDRLVTSALNGTVLLWDTSMVRTITRLNSLTSVGTRAHGVASLAYKEDRKLIFTAQYDGFCKVYSSQATAFDSSGGAVATLGGHQASLVGVAAIEDSDTLVTADRMGSMKLWDVRTWRSYQAISPARLPTYNTFFPHGADRLVLVGDRRLNFMALTEGPVEEDDAVEGLAVEASSRDTKQDRLVGMGINYVDREFLVVRSSKVSMYSVAHGKLLHEIIFPHNGNGFITAFAIDETTYERFFIGSSTGQVTSHNMNDGTLLEHFNPTGESGSLTQSVAAVSVSRPSCTESTNRPLVAACSSGGAVVYKVHGSSDIVEVDILDTELDSLLAFQSVIVALSRTRRRIYSIDGSDGTLRSASISNTGEMIAHCRISELSLVALLMSSGRVQVWRCLSGMPPSLQRDAYVPNLSHARTLCHIAPHADLTFLSERASEVDAGLDEIAAIDGDVDFLLTSSLRAPTKRLMHKQAVQLTAHKSLFGTTSVMHHRNTCVSETRHEQAIDGIGDLERHGLVVANKEGTAVVVSLANLHEKCRFSIRKGRQPPIEAMLHFTCSPILVLLRACDKNSIEIWDESGEFLGSNNGDGYQLPHSLVHLGTNVCTSLHAYNVMKELVGGEESSRIFTARAHCSHQNNASVIREVQSSASVVDPPVSSVQPVFNTTDGEEALRTPKSLLLGNVIKEYIQDHSHDMDHPGVLPAYLSGSDSAKNLNIKFNKIDSQYWYRPSQLSLSRRSFRSFADLPCRGRKLSMAARSSSAARKFIERQPSHVFTDSQPKQEDEAPRRPRSSMPFHGQRAEAYLSRSKSASRVRSSCRGSAVDSRRSVPASTNDRLRHEMRSATSTASTAATRPASRMSCMAAMQQKKAYQVEVDV